jgi:hypothetical protein
MSINLADLNATAASEAVFDLELKHPTTDAPLGLFIQVVGQNSERFQKLAKQQGNELLKQGFATQRGKSANITVESQERRSAELLARATVGWFEQEQTVIGKQPKKIDGLPFGETRLMFSEDAAIQLYSDPAYSWLLKQVDDAVSDLANFMKS